MLDLTELDKHPAWKLNRNEQPWGDGVVDVIYSCQVLKDGKWTIMEYGGTPELAINRALGIEDE